MNPRNSFDVLVVDEHSSTQPHVDYDLAYPVDRFELTELARLLEQPIRNINRCVSKGQMREANTQLLLKIGLLTKQMHRMAEAINQPDPWAPSGEDYDRSIHTNPDAKAWADFFVKTFPGQADKHDLLLGWFANAMMAMHDHLRQGTTVHRLENDERVVTFRVNAETKDAVFDRVMKFFEEQDQFSGEGIHQSDNCLIEAPSVLSDIADNILKFNVNYKEE